MEQPFYDCFDFPDLLPLLKCWQGLWLELSKAELAWVNYSIEENECVAGEWHIAPLFSRRREEGRKSKPRPRGLGRDGEKAFIRAVRETPEKIPKIVEWFESFERINFVGLSRMFPGCELDAHTHNNPDSLVMHIGLSIPKGESASLVVGDTEMVWREPGDYCIFDDSIPHSARNHGDTDRIILHVDFQKEV